jgi:hypothetical protein
VTGYVIAPTENKSRSRKACFESNRTGTATYLEKERQLHATGPALCVNVVRESVNLVAVSAAFSVSLLLPASRESGMDALRHDRLDVLRECDVVITRAHFPCL